ncbi:MAG: hypothetical protein LUH63_00955 [Parabacteroides sp.]|nr:hypothetical protein [Parabacteroides sp.]
MKQQCPKCGNWVEGKKKEDLKRNLTSGFLKGFVSGASNAILPGSGIITGALTQNYSNKLNNTLYGSESYEFICPNCAHYWIDLESNGTNNQLAKDQYLVQQMWEDFSENSDRIFSSTNNIDTFLWKWESKELISSEPKAEMNFLLAFCAYCANLDENSYLSIARKYINRALRNSNNKEYQLFAEVLNNKETNRNTASIVPNAISLLSDLTEDQVHFKQEWYWEQLQDAVDEEVSKYKEEKIREKKSYLIKNSLFAIPILLFVIYKYMNYDSPEGFWSTLFSWVPIYWAVLLTLGGAYLIVIADCNKVFSRKKEEWKEVFIGQYTSFKWSDLLK